jgi:glycerol uptake facilitator-like aquaporin
MIAPPRCFSERDPNLSLLKRSAAEAVGTTLLVAVVFCVGAATRGHAAAALEGAFAISGALVGLILALGPISGGHFNPLITLSQWTLGLRGGRCTAAYVVAQLVGAGVGAGIAAGLYPAVSAAVPTSHVTAVYGLSELVATAGLMCIILFASASRLGYAGPFAVGAWLLAAILVTPSGAFANPAAVFGALLTASSAHLAATDAAFYAVIEIIGAVCAILCLKALGPRGELEAE